MTFNQKIEQMFLAAKGQNITAREFSRKLLQNSPRRQSALKEYLILRGKTAPVGIIAQAEEAGNQILMEFENKNENPQELFSYPIDSIPGKYRQFSFYSFAAQYPAAFLACLLLAIDAPQYDNANGKLGEAWKNAKEFTKKTFDKAVEVVKDAAGDIASAGKKYFAAAPRTAFLGLVSLNVKNFAKRLDLALTKDRQGVKNFWESTGGDFAKLVSAVNNGKNKNPILPGQNFDPATVSAAIASATPVIVAVNELLKKINGDKDKELEGQSKPSGGGGNLPEIGTVKTPFGNISWGVTNNKAVLTGLALAAVALVAVFYFTRKGGK